MRQMLKYLCTFLLLVSLLFSMCSCHGKRGGDALGDYSGALTEFVSNGEFDPNKSYEVTFWAKCDSNPTQVAILDKAISDFQALYPNIKITPTYESDYGRIYQNVITNIPTGTVPNVAISYPDHVATYLTGDELVVPLDGLMSDEKYGLGGSEVRFDGPAANEMTDKFMDECVIDGHTYLMPFMRSTEACYVNVDMVEKLGYQLPEVLTWDFIWEVSEAALRKNDDGTYFVNNSKTLLPFIYKSTDNMMIQIIEQSKYDYSNPEGDILIFNEETKSILMDIVPHAESGAFNTFKIVSYPGNYFNCGQCIFAIDSTAGATWIGSDAPRIQVPEESLVEFETKVMTIPQVNTEKPKMISQGPSMCLFNKKDKGQVIASWLFMQYLLTNEVQLNYSYTEGYIPVTDKAINSDEYKDYHSRAGEDNDMHYKVKLDAAQLLIENTENTFVTPVFNGSANLRNAAGQLIEEVTKRVQHGDAVDDLYISNLYREMVALYHLEMEPGKLSVGAVVFLVILGAVDAALVGYLVYLGIGKYRNRKRPRRGS